MWSVVALFHLLEPNVGIIGVFVNLYGNEKILHLSSFALKNVSFNE